MRRLHRLARSNRGAALIAVAVFLAALCAIAILAVDISRLLVARAELQNAADAGALGGASLYLENGEPTDAEVIAEAKRVAAMNKAFADEGSELIPPEQVDVTVTFDEELSATKVEVITRSVVSQYFTAIAPRLMGGDDPTGGMDARESLVRGRAVALAGEVCDIGCVMPWTIPDRHDDSHTFLDPDPGNVTDWKDNGYWDGDKFVDSNGNGVYDAGEPVNPTGGGDANNNGQVDQEFYHPLLTGYTAAKDAGLQLTLKAGRPGDTKYSGQYYPVDLPDENGDLISGADWYRLNIERCNPYHVGPGDWLVSENGRMSGPTAQGMDELMKKDPNAKWDDACQCVVDSDFPMSPRIGLVPIHDPTIPMVEGKKSILITKMAAFFIEDIRGDGTVTGRFLKIQAPRGGFCEGGETNGGWIYRLALYE